MDQLRRSPLNLGKGILDNLDLYGFPVFSIDWDCWIERA